MPLLSSFSVEWNFYFLSSVVVAVGAVAVVGGEIRGQAFGPSQRVVRQAPALTTVPQISTCMYVLGTRTALQKYIKRILQYRVGDVKRWK